MRIAIASYGLLPQTGTSARTLGFVRAMVSKKHEATILGSNQPEHPEAGLVRSLGAEYVDVCPIAIQPGAGRSLVFALGLLHKLKMMSRRSRVDVVQFAGYSMNGFLYPLIRTSLGIPIVSDLHALESSRSHEPGLEHPLWQTIVFLVYERIALRFSDAVITPTEELRDCFRRYHKNVVAIPNCVPHMDGSARPTEASLKSQEYKVFFHANFFLERSVRELGRLAEIARRIQERGYTLKVSIAGPGTERLGVLREPLINLGYVDDPYRFLSDADLIILPVKDVTLGLHSRLVEAMAAGKPIAATREACCGLIPYLDESGIVVCDSIEEFVDAARSLLENKSRRKTLGERNSRLADRLFSVDAVASSLEQVYSTILKKR